MSMKTHPLHSKADIHRASLLKLVPKFAKDLELAANGFHVYECQIEWKMRLAESPDGDDLLISLFHGQGVVDLPRDMSKAQRGRDELDYRLDILNFFPGSVFWEFAKKRTAVGRPRITLINRFHAFDPSLVILKYLCGKSWVEAGKWIQRKRYRYSIENITSGISYGEVNQQSKSLDKRAATLKKELRPSSMDLGRLLDKIKLPKKGRYTDLKKPTAKDRDSMVATNAPINPQALTFQTTWDSDETTFHVLNLVLDEARKKRKVPTLVSQALNQLAKVVKQKTWAGLWPLSPVLPDGLGVGRCFGSHPVIK